MNILPNSSRVNPVPSQSTTYISFTQEQFDLLLNDRDQSLERERRALELAESFRDEKLALLIGLKHFTKKEVAELFSCSERQIDRFTESGALKPVVMLGKILYSAQTLLAFIRSHDNYPTVAETIQTNLSSFPKRHRRSVLTPFGEPVLTGGQSEQSKIY